MLLAGFRAAGWVCCGVLGLSALVTVVGWRGVGLVGRTANNDSMEKFGTATKPRNTGDIELGVITPEAEVRPRVPASSAASVNTAVEETLTETKKTDDADGEGAHEPNLLHEKNEHRTDLTHQVAPKGI